MINIDLITAIAFDVFSLVALSWTVWQEIRMRKKTGKGIGITQEEILKFETTINQLQADLKVLKDKTPQ